MFHLFRWNNFVPMVWTDPIKHILILVPMKHLFQWSDETEEQILIFVPMEEFVPLIPIEQFCTNSMKWNICSNGLTKLRKHQPIMGTKAGGPRRTRKNGPLTINLYVKSSTPSATNPMAVTRVTGNRTREHRASPSLHLSLRVG